MAKISVSYSRKAQKQLSELDKPVREYIMRSICDLSQVANKQMVVNGMTIYTSPHIVRAFKLYAVPPAGFRALFHFECSKSIEIDSVCARDKNPYEDSH